MSRIKRQNTKQRTTHNPPMIQVVERKVDIPKPLLAQAPQRFHRRFTLQAAIPNIAFSISSGHDQFLTVVAATGNAICYVDMWRIRRIKVWNSNSTGGFVLTTLGSDTTDNFVNSRERTYTADAARSTDQPSTITVTPSGPMDPLFSWHETSNVNFSGPLFSCLTGLTTGVTMDISFEAILNTVGLPNGYAVVTTVTNLGTLLARPILSGGMNPVGVNTG